MSQLDSIVFDLGNVLISWDPRNLYKKIFKESEEMEYFLTHVCSQSWNHTLDGGRDWNLAIADKVKEFPKYESEIRAYKDRWPEMLDGEIVEVVRVLRKLSAVESIQLFAITNWAHETWPIAQDKFSFLKLFKDIVVSGIEGVCKPEPQIFELLLERNQLQAHQCVFIDDSFPNVIRARELGFHSHHFLDPDSLKIWLKDCGFLIPVENDD
ncbi:MAG: HAD family phosphatase [Bdellovibrionales bacterium]|nr:HAD family phosphatase [Bdellovibrionales bacterium]